MQGFNLDSGGFGEVNHGINFSRVVAESSGSAECLQFAGLLRLTGWAGNEPTIGLLGIGFTSPVTE